MREKVNESERQRETETSRHRRQTDSYSQIETDRQSTQLHGQTGMGTDRTA